MADPQQYVVLNRAIDTDQRVVTRDDSNGPVFTLAEIAKVFFGKSAYWGRNLAARGFIGDLGFKGRDKRREFRLSEVESLIRLIRVQKRIDDEQHLIALSILTYITRLWRL